jgi:meso-butanediol dehydrogenase/(S,S)-butanediol dehydrogenase/diacetyl reductase
MLKFDEQIGIVTGGASGIGLAVAQGYARGGGHAVIADTNRDAGDAAVKELGRGGHSAEFVDCNMTDSASIEQMIQSVHERHGRIDFLHNNAYAAWKGTDAGALVDGVSDEQWQHVLEIGLTSTFRATRAVLPLMVAKGGGSIVNTASVAAFRAEPRIACYSTIKAGIVQFTRTVAVEYAASQIRCNSVCPGVIRTPLIEGAPLGEDFLASIPMGRLGEAEEVANVVLFLASGLASYLTGETIVIDGGRTL